MSDAIGGPSVQTYLAEATAATRPDPAARILALFGSRVIFGAERENIEVLSALRQQGCDVLCLVRHEAWNEEVPAALVARGLAVRRLPYLDGWLPGWRMWILLRNPVAFVVGNWRFLTIARRFRPTHIHTFNTFFVWSFLPAILMLRTPLIYRCGDVPVRHRWVWRAFWRIVVRRTQRFMAISRFIAGKLEAAGVPPDRIEVIYGIPPARLSAPAPVVASMPAIGPQDVVFVGQIIRDKGPHLLVEAFGALAARYPRCRLLIAGRIADWHGDDWAKNLLDRVAQDPRLATRVLFTGFVDDVPAFLRGRTVLVAPTVIEEALGLVVMEAKAAGVPAIVFPTGGLPEMIEDGVDGFVCRETTAEALAEALALYLDDPGLAERHGRAAHASLQRFDVDRFSARCLAVYSPA